MLTGRQIGIVKLLYSQETFITMMQIAKQTGVSQKTVRNDMAAIKEFCQKYNVGKVLTKPHEGVMILCTKEEWERFLHKHEEIADDYAQADIKSMAIRLLLKRKSVSFGELERKLFTSRAAVEKELPEIKKWFQSHNLLLEKKRGKGMEIFYSEFHYRMAMWHFAGYWRQKSKTEQEIINDLLEGFDGKGAESAINQLELEQGIIFSYEAHQQLLFLLSFTIGRIRKKSFVEREEITSCRIDSDIDSLLAASLTEKLETYYQIHIPKEEQKFICFLIRTVDIQGYSSDISKQRFENENLELCCITMKLANLFGEIINIDLKSDAAFVGSLMLQLRTTIQRLHYHVVWKHPLLKQVKQKYPNIFAAVYAVGIFFDRELGMGTSDGELKIEKF